MTWPDLDADFENPNEVKDEVLLLRALVCAEALGGSLPDHVCGIVGDHGIRGYGSLLPLSAEQRSQLLSSFGPFVIGVRERDYLFTMYDLLDKQREINEEQQQNRDRTCLYRFLDDHDRLLYVGVAYNPDTREKQHRSSQRWAPLIDRREDEWFDTRRAALDAETAAIRDESPLFNEAGRPRLPSLPQETT